MNLSNKGLSGLDNHDDVVTHLEPEILECEVKWTLGIITMNKRSTSDLEAHTDWEWGDRKGSPYKWKSEEPGVVILISDKIDIQIKTVTRDKEGPYMMIKGSIKEDKTTVNIYAPNIGTPQYVRKILTERATVTQ